MRVVVVLLLTAPTAVAASCSQFVAPTLEQADAAAADSGTPPASDAAARPSDAEALDAPAGDLCADKPPLTAGPGEFLVDGEGCTELSLANACGGTLAASYTYSAGCLPRTAFESELEELLECDLPLEKIQLAAKLKGTLDTTAGFSPNGALVVQGSFDLPAACKAELGSGLVGCPQLGSAASLIGIRGVTCCDIGSVGDCHCVLDSSAVLTKYPSYTVQGNELVMTDKRFPYCVGARTQIGRNTTTNTASFVLEELVTWTLIP